MKNEEIFEMVLSANAKYVKAVNERAEAEVQEALLSICDALFRNSIKKAGLLSEYAYYCECKRLRA